MNMNYKICFVCTGNACRSPFAECVTKKLLADAGMSDIEVFSLGTLDWGENPRDAEMVDMARELGYELCADFWLRRYEVKNFWRLWEFDYICGLKRFLCWRGFIGCRIVCFNLNY